MDPVQDVLMASIIVCVAHSIGFLSKDKMQYVGPSGVRALPLAAGINVGGYYKWHFFLFFLSLFLSSGSLLIFPEGVVVEIHIFAWAPN